MGMGMGTQCRALLSILPLLQGREPSPFEVHHGPIATHYIHTRIAKTAIMLQKCPIYCSFFITNWVPMLIHKHITSLEVHYE